MNTIVFPESVVGKESAGAYVRADEARARITELEKQLSRYQGGVEVEGFYSETYDNLTSDPCIALFDRLLLDQNQRVRVLVMKEVE